MIRIWWIVPALVSGLAGRAVSQSCSAIGNNRWAVKTMAPASGTPRAMDATAFAALPAPPDFSKKGGRKQATRYPAPIVAGLHEGDPVALSGWAQFIKSSDDDCDYHIQVTPTKSGKRGTIIVEIPQPDAAHVQDPGLRSRLTAARAALLSQLGLKTPPTSKGVWLKDPVYLEFTGALFFDGNDYPKCSARGRRVGAATCWELHPVTAVRVVQAPAGQ